MGEEKYERYREKTWEFILKNSSNHILKISCVSINSGELRKSNSYS